MKKQTPRTVVAFSAAALALGAMLLAAPAVRAETGAVSYKADIQPIFNTHCVTCHRPGGEGHEASGLDLSTYAGVMKGTKHGAIVSPGDALTSNLMAVLEGRTDASIRMPHSKSRDMTKEDRNILRRWVLDGATKEGFAKGPSQVIGELCLRCHQPGGMGFEASGLDMTSYENLMKGTKHGPVIVPGDVNTSNLIVVVEGRASSMLKMPHNETPEPNTQDRNLLRRWILQGAQNN